MRIDSHHHLWTRAVTPQTWLNQDMVAIDRDFEVSDLETTVGDRADRTVLVQTAATIEETERFLDLAKATPLIGAVVGWADLTAPDLTDTLDRLRSSGHGAWLRGIRHQVQDEADPCWLERPDVLRGLRTLGEHGLVYDLLTLPHQLPAAITAVRQLPEVRFVLDHLSKPPIAAIAAGDRDALRTWSADLGRLAALPNVSAKLSGLVTEADWTRWTIADIRPIVDVAIETFGPTRLLVGSDWPVCLLAASYAQVDELHHELVAGLSPPDQDLVFGANAASLYGIT